MVTKTSFIILLVIVVLGYLPVGTSYIWVCLLNKCEIANSYCRAITRFGIRPCEKNSN